MATTTDLEQTGRDANILHNYLDGEPPLRPASEYGRLGQLILRLIEELGSGTLLQYDGRVDSVGDLPETGQLNHFYLVGPEDASEFDEYFWVQPEGETGHWDRLGSVAIIIDDHLDLNSTNPVQNGIITAAINAINLAVAAAAKQTALAPTLVFATAYTDGTLVTYAGELYKADSVNGSYIVEDQATSTSKFVKIDVASLFDGLATVAKTGSYNDLTDKPTIPTVTDRLKSIAAAAEYDPTHTYIAGEYMTLNGELYKHDANGSAIPVGEDLLKTYASRLKDSTYGYRDNTAMSSDSGGTFKYNINDSYISGAIPVASGKTYRINSAAYARTYWRAFERPGAYFSSSSTGNTNQKWVPYSIDGSALAITTEANASYLLLSIYKANESQYSVYELTSQTFTKTTIMAELAGKADTFTIDADPTDGSLNPVSSNGVYGALANKIDISNLVTVTNTGDIYIGSQLVRKVLTQAEYDALATKDPKVEYLVPEETEGE